jgi:hypothetical protein
LRTRNVFSWASLGALAIGAACAQGSSDTSSSPIGTLPDGGSFALEGGDLDSGNSIRLSTDSGTPPGDDTNDSGGPVGDDDGAAPGDDDASSGEDSGNVTPVDAGHDSGSPPPVSVVPTTCSGADEGVGCCVGNQLYYCNELDEVHETSCKNGEVCGWDVSNKYYGCVASPGGTDPSGVHSIACK